MAFRPYFFKALELVNKTKKISREAWNRIEFKKLGLDAIKQSHQTISATRPYHYAKWGLIGSLTLKTGYVYGTGFSREITVNKTFNQLKETSGGITNEYMIADEKSRLYKVTSSFWYWQWFPDELYATIKEGNKYKIRGYGIRIRQLGIHPRLVHAYPL